MAALMIESIALTWLLEPIPLPAALLLGPRIVAGLLAWRGRRDDRDVGRLRRRKPHKKTTRWRSSFFLRTQRRLRKRGTAP